MGKVQTGLTMHPRIVQSFKNKTTVKESDTNTKLAFNVTVITQ